MKEIRELAAKYDVHPQQNQPVVIARDGDIVYIAMKESDYQAVEQWLNRLYERRQRAMLAPEVEAYRHMLPKLLESHREQWVAIFKGNLIDSDPERAALIKRLRQTHHGESMYIMQVEEQFPPEDLMDTPEEDDDFVPV